MLPQFNNTFFIIINITILVRTKEIPYWNQVAA